VTASTRIFDGSAAPLMPDSGVKVMSISPPISATIAGLPPV
jgi:hypothetical protein